jgi:hypothetical protein
MQPTAPMDGPAPRLMPDVRPTCFAVTDVLEHNMWIRSRRGSSWALLTMPFLLCAPLSAIGQQTSAPCQEMRRPSSWQSYTPDARKFFETLAIVDLDPAKVTFGSLARDLKEPPQESESTGPVTRFSWYGGAVTATFRTSVKPAPGAQPIEIGVKWPFLGGVRGIRLGTCPGPALAIGQRAGFKSEATQWGGADWQLIGWDSVWTVALEMASPVAKGSISRLVAFKKSEPNWIPRSSPTPRTAIASGGVACDQLAQPSAKLAIFAGFEVARSDSKTSAYAKAPCSRWVVDIDVMSVPNPAWAPKFAVLGTIDPQFEPSTSQDCQSFRQDLAIFKKIGSSFVPVVTATAGGQWIRGATGHNECRFGSKPDGISAPSYVPPIVVNTATEVSGLRGLMFWLDRPDMAGDSYRNESYRISLAASISQVWRPVSVIIRYDNSWRQQ